MVTWEVDGRPLVAFFDDESEANDFARGDEYFDPNAIMKKVTVMNDLFIVCETEVKANKFLWKCENCGDM